ncbi:hypothetical protein R3P38DRAFT_3265723 [Favolaschia claudopus]|uniref:Uncharacterized protein n=1 Tax=Favolaschia claudopus TaxID=2862362 RepID=A0AAW0BWY8_9AGAR
MAWAAHDDLSYPNAHPEVKHVHFFADKTARHIRPEASARVSLVSSGTNGPPILGTEKGLQALAEFLEKTGAFTKTGQPRRTMDPLELVDEEDGRVDE